VLSAEILIFIVFYNPFSVQYFLVF